MNSGVTGVPISRSIGQLLNKSLYSLSLSLFYFWFANCWFHRSCDQFIWRMIFITFWNRCCWVNHSTLGCDWILRSIISHKILNNIDCTLDVRQFVTIDFFCELSLELDYPCCFAFNWLYLIMFAQFVIHYYTVIIIMHIRYF